MTNKNPDQHIISRRDSLKVTGGAVFAASVPAGNGYSATTEEAKSPVNFITKIDFKDPKWNRDTYARLDADIDPTKQKVGWLKGRVYGVRDNEKVRPLFQLEGFGVVRTKRLEDGSWRRMLREIVFYRDLESGEILETWFNPYTQEDVKVVPIANDPFNFTISEYAPEPPSYGGLNTEKPPRMPFLLDWEEGPNGTIILSTDIHLYYPNALQPNKWPRESSGAFNRVSELFMYTFKREDAENPSLTHIPATGAWSRVTPWLPWMLMGDAPGHINYFTTFTTLPGGIDELPQDIVEATRAVDPKFLSAPTEDYGPSLSSLENYAREHTPAPVPEGWSPPQLPEKPDFSSSE